MNEENVKQQINLYDKRFREDESVFSGRRIVNVFLIFIASLALISVYMYFVEIKGKRTELAILQVELDDLASDRERREKLIKTDKTAELENEVKRLSEEKERKVRIRKALTGAKLGNDKGFSVHLEGLAKQIIPKVWLTEIMIDNGGTNLAIFGKTVDPETVPRYIRKLSSEEAFAGSDFNTFFMALPDDEEDEKVKGKSKEDKKASDKKDLAIEFALLTETLAAEEGSQ